MAKAKARQASPKPALDVLAQEVERDYAQSDGWVISRMRDVLMYEQKALEDYLASLSATVAGVREKKARIEARIEAMTVVLSRR